MKPELINSSISPTAKIYNGARVKKSKISNQATVGNFSRVDYSVLSNNVRIDRNNHLFHSNLGIYTYTGMNTIIMHATVKKFCSISWNVTIGGANHDYKRVTQHSFVYNQTDNIRPDLVPPAYDRFESLSQIENDVWIGAGAIINRGVVIGNGAIIGANATVTKDVPPYAIVAGNPARLIKYRFETNIIDVLQQLCWWDWPITKIKKYYNVLSDVPKYDELKKMVDNFS